jgi:hypothetical protein
MSFLSTGIITSISMHVFSFVFNYYIWPILYLCVPLDSRTLSHIHVHIPAWVCLFVCAYHFSVVSMPSALHIQ